MGSVQAQRECPLLSAWNSSFRLKLYFCDSVTYSRPTLFTTSHGCEFADRRVKRSTNHSRLGFLGGGPQSDMIQKQNVFETCWSGLAEMNSLRIIRATKTVFHVANTYSKYTSLFYFLRIFIHCNTQTDTRAHTRTHTLVVRKPEVVITSGKK